MAGRLCFIAVGADQVVIERIEHTRRVGIATRLAEHRRQFGTARLLWSIRMRKLSGDKPDLPAFAAPAFPGSELDVIAEEQ
jgi:hypothetical protein